MLAISTPIYLKSESANESKSDTLGLHSLYCKTIVIAK